jgi:hypothetical protein
MAKEAPIEHLELLTGCRLPEDYRSFLLADEAERSSLIDLSYDTPNDPTFDGDVIDHVADIEGVISCLEFDQALMEGGTPPEFFKGALVIAGNGCGDILVLSVRSEDFGAIYHCSHETVEDEGLSFVAANFSEWRSSLKPLDESTRD